MCSDDTTVRIPLRAQDGSVRAYALVDAADADWVNQWRWSLNIRLGYAHRGDYSGCRRHTIYLHRALLGLALGDTRTGDHKNRNRLDNRRDNLRILPKGKNAHNLPSYAGSSSYRGVHWSKSQQKWVARVKVGGRTIEMGAFHDEMEAAEAARTGRAQWLPYAMD